MLINKSSNKKKKSRRRNKSVVSLPTDDIDNISRKEENLWKTTFWDLIRFTFSTRISVKKILNIFPLLYDMKKGLVCGIMRNKSLGMLI